MIIERPHTQTQNKYQYNKKINLETIQRIMSDKKSTLPSFKNQDWQALKVETEKNKRNNNTYLKKQHHGIKRINLCRGEIIKRKINVYFKDMKKNSKPQWGIRLEI